MIRYYKIVFSFSRLTSYQREAVLKCIPQSCKVAFGELSLCVFSVRGKKMANKIRSEISDYLDYCHVMHFSELTLDV